MKKRSRQISFGLLLAPFLLFPGVTEAQFPEFLDANVVWSSAPGATVKLTADDVQPIFNFIPGALYGTPSEDLPIIPIGSVGTTRVQFPLYLLNPLVDSFAEPFTAESTESGLRADPADTRLVRIGTFFLPTTLPYFDSAGFLDEESGNQLMLIYVDRPSTISGAVQIGAKRITHELVFDEAGFHWVDGSLNSGKVSSTTTDVSPSFRSPHLIE